MKCETKRFIKRWIDKQLLFYEIGDKYIWKSLNRTFHRNVWDMEKTQLWPSDYTYKHPERENIERK